jgi:hypothetical protein
MRINLPEVYNRNTNSACSTQAHMNTNTVPHNSAMKRIEGVHEALLLLFMQSAKLLGTVVRVDGRGGGYRM